MMDLNRIYHVTKADFLQRARSYQFYVTLVITLYLACLFVPDISTQYATLMVNGYRGIYTTGWIGISVAISTSLFLCLFGFYLVKNTLTRDEALNVGQLFATSSTDNITYILGKVLSNFLILASLMGSAILASGLMFFLRGESKVFDLWTLVSPFLILVTPTIIVISVVALLFEIIPWFKGSFGNVVYFSLWMMALILPTSLLEGGCSAESVSFVDVFGLQQVTEIIQNQMPNIGTDNEVNIGLITSVNNGGIKRFDWPGIHWTWSILQSRLMWITIAVLMTGLCALFFRRFEERDHSQLNKTKIKGKGTIKHILRQSTSIHDTNTHDLLDDVLRHDSLKMQSKLIHEDLPAGNTFLSILKAELKIMLKGLNKWWYIGMVAAIFLEIVTPAEFSINLLLPLSWIFPISIWSAMGIRETRHNTAQIIFACFGSLKYQFSALYLAAP